MRTTFACSEPTAGGSEAPHGATSPRTGEGCAWERERVGGSVKAPVAVKGRVGLGGREGWGGEPRGGGLSKRALRLLRQGSPGILVLFAGRIVVVELLKMNCKNTRIVQFLVWPPAMVSCRPRLLPHLSAGTEAAATWKAGTIQDDNIAHLQIRMGTLRDLFG